MKKRVFSYLAKRLAMPAAIAGTVLLGYVLLTSQIGPVLVENVKRTIELVGSRVTKVTTPATIVVEKLQKLNRLETIRQTSSQIIEAKSNSSMFPDFLAKDSLQMMVQTEVICGIDLSRLASEDVTVTPGRVTVTLPQPELFEVRINDNVSKVYGRQRGWLMFNPDKDLERQARLEAQHNARTAASTSSVMEEARTNAEEGLRNLLQSLGFKEIEFKWESV